MKKQKLNEGYISPQTELIDIMPISVLCQSPDKFSTSLEDMTENDYNFKF